MKIRLSVKTIVWFWIGLAAIVMTLMFYAYHNLNPDSLLGLMKQQVQRNYPGSNLTVEDINYSMRLNFTINARKIKIERKNRQIAEIEKLEIRLPWWLLLFNYGRAHINLTNLDVYLEDEFKKESTLQTSASSSNLKKVKINIPEYMVDAQYTLRAKNISIRNRTRGKRLLFISKLLVKEFQYGKNSAFELNLPINITHLNHKFALDLWLFGDVTPHLEKWSMTYRGELKARELTDRFEFSDLVIEGKSVIASKSADVISNFDLTVDNKPIGSGQLKIDAKTIGLAVKFSTLPLEYLSLVGEEVKNPFLATFEGVAKGGFELTKPHNSGGAILLKGKLHFPGRFTLADMEPISGNWKLLFDNGKWESSFLSPEGKLNYFRRSFIDFQKKTTIQYNEEIGFKGLDLSLPVAAVGSLDKILSRRESDFHSTHISITQCKSGSDIYTGFFNTGNLPDHSFYQAELVSKTKKFLLNFQEKGDSSNLEANFNQFQVGIVQELFSPYLTAKSLVLDGKLQGQWSIKWYKGMWNSDLKFSQIDDLNGLFVDMVTTTANVFDLDIRQSPSYKLNFSMKNSKLKLTSLSLEGSDPALVSGEIKTGALTSVLTLRYPNNKRWKPVKKETANIINVEGI